MDYTRQIDGDVSKNTENVAVERQATAAVDAILSAWPGRRVMETTQYSDYPRKNCRPRRAAYESTHHSTNIACWRRCGTFRPGCTTGWTAGKNYWRRGSPREKKRERFGKGAECATGTRPPSSEKRAHAPTVGSGTPHGLSTRCPCGSRSAARKSQPRCAPCCAVNVWEVENASAGNRARPCVLWWGDASVGAEDNSARKSKRPK